MDIDNAADRSIEIYATVSVDTMIFQYLGIQVGYGIKNLTSL